MNTSFFSTYSVNPRISIFGVKSNHLGNVLNVITDRKLPIQLNSTGKVDYYTADVVAYNDYMPFGALMEGRHGYEGKKTRFGFNNKEQDDEVEGEGNSIDFGARMYNSRLGRWLSMDRHFMKYPDQSPYKAFNNNPIMFVDPSGNDEFLSFVITDKQTGITTILRVPNAISDKIMTDGVVHDTHVNGECYTKENFYYDFRTIVYISIDKNGKAEVTKKASLIIEDNGVKDDSYVWNHSAAPGTIYDPWDGINLEGNGGTQNGGFKFSQSGGGASETKMKSIYAAPKRDIGLLLTLLGKLNGTSLGGKWQDQINSLSGIVSDYSEAIGYQGEETFEAPKEQWVLNNFVTGRSGVVTNSPEVFSSKAELLKKYKDAKPMEGSPNTFSTHTVEK